MCKMKKKSTRVEANQRKSRPNQSGIERCGEGQTQSINEEKTRWKEAWGGTREGGCESETRRNKIDIDVGQILGGVHIRLYILTRCTCGDMEERRGKMGGERWTLNGDGREMGKREINLEKKTERRQKEDRKKTGRRLKQSKAKTTKKQDCHRGTAHVAASRGGRGCGRWRGQIGRCKTEPVLTAAAPLSVEHRREDRRALSV